MYTVTEWLGDYPIEDQMFWGDKLRTLKAANFLADKLYDEKLVKAMGKDYYVLVEKFVGVSDVGIPLIAYTINGGVSNEELTTFLKQYEGE